MIVISFLFAHPTSVSEKMESQGSQTPIELQEWLICRKGTQVYIEPPRPHKASDWSTRTYVGQRWST